MKISITQIGNKFKDLTVIGDEINLNDVEKVTLKKIYNDTFLNENGKFSGAASNLTCEYRSSEKALIIPGRFFKVRNIYAGDQFLITFKIKSSQSSVRTFWWPELSGDPIEVELESPRPLETPETLEQKKSEEKTEQSDRDTLNGPIETLEQKKSEKQIEKDKQDETKEETKQSKYLKVKEQTKPTWLYAFSCLIFLITLTGGFWLNSNGFFSKYFPTEMTDSACADHLINELRTMSGEVSEKHSDCISNSVRGKLISKLKAEAEQDKKLYKFLAQFYSGDLNERFWGNKYGFSQTNDLQTAIFFYGKAYQTGEDEIFNTLQKACRLMHDGGDIFEKQAVKEECNLVNVVHD